MQVQLYGELIGVFLWPVGTREGGVPLLFSPVLDWLEFAES